MIKGNGNGSYVDLIAQKHPKSAAAEAYRTLRTNLGFAAPDHPARLIMATSAGPGDGKTSTMSNLAVVLAQTGQNVCLVDCDLRKPRIHKVFEIDNTRGLTNVLLQNAVLDEVIIPAETAGLFLFPSGPIPPNPAELIGSEKIKDLWPQLLERYDYVLVDAPPVLAVTDASLLAGQMDGVILIVKSGTSRVDMIQDAKAQLVKANSRILGVVLNQVRMSQKDYSYYYYYHGKSKEDQIRL
ncbi:MAG: polysaccharide biosynthesis tyrosine autokinase [Desulforudis sp.]|nr:MAG: polysaccharide biosynthesis tyrosine autokinase [Desulforudis sp.]